MSKEDSFNTKSKLPSPFSDVSYYSLPKLAKKFPQVGNLPFSLKIVLENMLRNEDGVSITAKHIEYLATLDFTKKRKKEISFSPARVIMQDFTGVPAIADLASMRDAMTELKGNPKRINPITPVELVIDHSLMVDRAGTVNSLDLNKKMEYQRNKERYEFLKWGSKAFNNLKVVPPSTGIVHQVNLEYLARVVFSKDYDGENISYFDTVVGTDSHTTMINGLGVLGWGVGGIEAEAVMLGQPISMLIPEVIGFELTGKLTEGVTATDLVLTIVEMLRKEGVVGKFVEFFGPGLQSLSLADRATIANMAPEYGATCGIFPIDKETINYLKLTNRNEKTINLIETYTKSQGVLANYKKEIPTNFHKVVSLDLTSVMASIAGPKRPQDRIELSSAKKIISGLIPKERKKLTVSLSNGDACEISDGSVVIAAITSCTNTSNPGVIIAAGLLAKKAYSLGLRTNAGVKTSLAPGSVAVTGYLQRSGLLEYLEHLKFHIVGYGCTTCIGNSGPLDSSISNAIAENKLNVSAVLSGNRNFEGRVHPEVKMNFLASPPLVVAYALAGRCDIDFANEPISYIEGNPIFLKDIWPKSSEINDAVARSVNKKLYDDTYKHVFDGDSSWQDIDTDTGDVYQWDKNSTYVQRPPFFDDMQIEVAQIPSFKNLKVLAKLGDSITTDHISPAGSIKEEGPAGDHLKSKNVSKNDFNSFGSRRGNHHIMMRGTFANVRLRNLLAPGTEGGYTKYHPTGEIMTIYDAAMKYKEKNIPLVVLAGKEYGSGSSRDWAAKGPALLGVKMVIAASYERIHRSNLVGMGILPLQFAKNQNHEILKLNGDEDYSLEGFKQKDKKVTVIAKKGKRTIKFTADVRIDTPKEWDYFLNNGILNFMVRKFCAT